jgi:hypothetical protein
VLQRFHGVTPQLPDMPKLLRRAFVLPVVLFDNSGDIVVHALYRQGERLRVVVYYFGAQIIDMIHHIITKNFFIYDDPLLVRLPIKISLIIREAYHKLLRVG